jgi:RNA recognition motif-containing protein
VVWWCAQDRNTGEGRRFAIIDFYNHDDAAKAIEALNGTGFDSLILNVVWAIDPGSMGSLVANGNTLEFWNGNTSSHSTIHRMGLENEKNNRREEKKREKKERRNERKERREEKKGKERKREGRGKEGGKREEVGQQEEAVLEVQVLSVTFFCNQFTI